MDDGGVVISGYKGNLLWKNPMSSVIYGSRTDLQLGGTRVDTQVLGVGIPCVTSKCLAPWVILSFKGRPIEGV